MVAVLEKSIRDVKDENAVSFRRRISFRTRSASGLRLVMGSKTLEKRRSLVAIERVMTEMSLSLICIIRDSSPVD